MEQLRILVQPLWNNCASWFNHYETMALLSSTTIKQWRFLIKPLWNNCASWFNHYQTMTLLGSTIIKQWRFFIKPLRNNCAPWFKPLSNNGVCWFNHCGTMVFKNCETIVLLGSTIMNQWHYLVQPLLNIGAFLVQPS